MLQLFLLDDDFFSKYLQNVSWLLMTEIHSIHYWFDILAHSLMSSKIKNTFTELCTGKQKFSGHCTLKDTRTNMNILIIECG